ncbi:MAG: hypothetical protein ACOVQA_11915, partial [Thermoflexibacteraceae bacterium]
KLGDAACKDTLDKIFELRKDVIKRQESYPEKPYVIEIGEIYKKKRFIITLTPNLLIFSIGLFSWCFFCFSPSIRQLNTWYAWLIFYTSLFLGQFIKDGLIVFLRKFVINSSLGYSDLELIALNLQMPRFSLLISLFLVTTILCLFLFFKFLPQEHRLRIFTSALIGATLGTWTWFNGVGNLILPE